MTMFVKSNLPRKNKVKILINFILENTTNKVIARERYYFERLLWMIGGINKKYHNLSHKRSDFYIVTLLMERFIQSKNQPDADIIHNLFSPGYIIDKIHIPII